MLICCPARVCCQKQFSYLGSQGIGKLIRDMWQTSSYMQVGLRRPLAVTMSVELIDHGWQHILCCKRGWCCDKVWHAQYRPCSCRHDQGWASGVGVEARLQIPVWECSYKFVHVEPMYMQTLQNSCMHVICHLAVLGVPQSSLSCQLNDACCTDLPCASWPA